MRKRNRTTFPGKVLGTCVTLHPHRGSTMRTGHFLAGREADNKASSAHRPFMGSILTVDQMPVMGDPNRIDVQEFPGGHMFYTRPANQGNLQKLAETMVETH
jgi:hypothetical protein